MFKDNDSRTSNLWQISIYITEVVTACDTCCGQFVQQQYELATQMDSADSDSVKRAICKQGQRICQEEELLSAVRLEVQGLAERQESLQSTVCKQINHLVSLVQALQSQSVPASASPAHTVSQAP